MGQNLEPTLKAQAWAEHLAGIDRREQSKLSSGISYRWRSLGENVGVGSSIASVHQSYMDSSGHRANIPSNKFNDVGTGCATGGAIINLADPIAHHGIKRPKCEAFKRP